MDDAGVGVLRQMPRHLGGKTNQSRKNCPGLRSVSYGVPRFRYDDFCFTSCSVPWTILNFE